MVSTAARVDRYINIRRRLLVLQQSFETRLSSLKYRFPSPTLTSFSPIANTPLEPRVITLLSAGQACRLCLPDFHDRFICLQMLSKSTFRALALVLGGDKLHARQSLLIAEILLRPFSYPSWDNLQSYQNSVHKTLFYISPSSMLSLFKGSNTKFSKRRIGVSLMLSISLKVLCLRFSHCLFLPILISFVHFHIVSGFLCLHFFSITSA